MMHCTQRYDQSARRKEWSINSNRPQKENMRSPKHKCHPYVLYDEYVSIPMSTLSFNAPDDVANPYRLTPLSVVYLRWALCIHRLKHSFLPDLSCDNDDSQKRHGRKCAMLQVHTPSNSPNGMKGIVNNGHERKSIENNELSHHSPEFRSSTRSNSLSGSVLLRSVTQASTCTILQFMQEMNRN
jgi:hypothetical protein